MWQWIPENILASGKSSAPESAVHQRCSARLGRRVTLLGRITHGSLQGFQAGGVGFMSRPRHFYPLRLVARPLRRSASVEYLRGLPIRFLYWFRDVTELLNHCKYLCSELRPERSGGCWLRSVRGPSSALGRSRRRRGACSGRSGSDPRSNGFLLIRRSPHRDWTITQHFVCG